MRLALGLEYAGTAYSGWQALDGRRTVQGELEAALARVADQPVAVVCAGRTDAGVHALAQVVHCDVDAVRPLRGWVLGANTHLPPDIAVTWACQVADGFHARFSATARRYRYLILDRRTRAAVWADRVAWSPQRLDAEAMHAAAQCLVGRHDFSSFRAADCQSKSPVRLLESITVNRSDGLVSIEVQANAFLHHMVRNLAGSLLMVGRGERPVAWLAEVLAAADRRVAGPTGVPGGLYFAGVRYPAAFGVPPVREWTESAAPALDPTGAAGPADPSGIMRTSAAEGRTGG